MSYRRATKQRLLQRVHMLQCSKFVVDKGSEQHFDVYFERYLCDTCFALKSIQVNICFVVERTYLEQYLHFQFNAHSYGYKTCNSIERILKNVLQFQFLIKECQRFASIVTYKYLRHNECNPLNINSPER